MRTDEDFFHELQILQAVFGGMEGITEKLRRHELGQELLSQEELLRMDDAYDELMEIMDRSYGRAEEIMSGLEVVANMDDMEV